MVKDLLLLLPHVPAFCAHEGTGTQAADSAFVPAVGQ